MSPKSRVYVWAFAPIAFLLSVAAPVFAQQPAGTIKTVTGAGFVVRAGQELRATVGQPVYEADTLKTASDGRLGITLKDGTRLSLAGDTEVQLNSFAYAPAEGKLGIALKMLRGAAAYISGRIASLAPASVKIETPTSVIGVRGTHVLIAVDQP